MDFAAARRKWETVAGVSSGRSGNDDGVVDDNFQSLGTVAKALARERAAEAEKQREIRAERERERRRTERDRLGTNAMSSAEFMGKAAGLAARAEGASSTYSSRQHADSHWRTDGNATQGRTASLPREDSAWVRRAPAATASSGATAEHALKAKQHYGTASFDAVDDLADSVDIELHDELHGDEDDENGNDDAYGQYAGASHSHGNWHSQYAENAFEEEGRASQLHAHRRRGRSQGSGDVERVGDLSDDLSQEDQENFTNSNENEDDFGNHSGSDEHSDGSHSEEPIVRQNSNFSRLSAQSWLTVDSAEDLDDAKPIDSAAPAGSTGGKDAAGSSSAAPIDPKKAVSSFRAVASRRRRNDSGGFDELPDLPKRDSISVKPVLVAATHMDVRQVERRATGGLMDIMDLVRGKSMTSKTVLECAIELMAGMPAYKKKAFRRFGVRRVWLSADCERLCWTSKKDGIESDFIRLSRVARLRCVDREVSVDVMEGHRISLLFANAQEASMWTRCLSFLTPLQSRVRSSSSNVIPSDKEREDYNLVDDYFNGRPLRSYGSVNAYVVLGPVKGHSGEARLVLSRADKAFFSLRYVPPNGAPFLLRSHEEIAVLKRLSHPNLVKYHECLLDRSRGGNYMVFEYTPRGVVTDTHRLEGVSPVPERAARIILRDVINALEYMHALRIVHADVRPDNLLRAVNGSVKLNPIGCITQDFTEIRDMSSLVRARLGPAPPAFLAPELCWHGATPRVPHKSYAMDVWAVGAVLYFLLYGRVPFGGATGKEIQENICSAKLKFPRMPETSRKVRNLLKGVLGEKDPKTRIGLSELKQHPWFAEGLEEEQVYQSRGPINFRLVVSAEEVESAVAHAKVQAPPRQ